MFEHYGPGDIGTRIIINKLLFKIQIFLETSGIFYDFHFRFCGLLFVHFFDFICLLLMVRDLMSVIFLVLRQNSSILILGFAKRLN